MVRTKSPARISGVTPSQHAPPGWLTSAKPSGVGMMPVALLTMIPPVFDTRRITWTVTTSSGRKPLGEMKSREGKTMMLIGSEGGSLTGKLLTSSCGTAVIWLLVFDIGEALPTASKARTWNVYTPGGVLRSTKVVGAGADASGFCTVKIGSPLR